MSGVVWEDPPPPRGSGVDWSAICAALREHPGRWARVASYKTAKTAGSVANQVNSGRSVAMRPAGSFEAKARALTDGSTYAVYARYVGHLTTTTTDPSASSGAGRPRLGAGEGDPGRAGGSRPGSPPRPLPEPQPVSPPSAGPESGGQADPSARSLAEGADAAPPCADPVAQGGAAGEAAS